MPHVRICGGPGRVALKNLELVAKSDVLQGELSTGSEDGDSRIQDDFEHLFMLYSGLRNRYDTKAEEIFGEQPR